MAIWQFDLSFFPLGGAMPWKTADGHEFPAIQPQKVAHARDWLAAHFGEPSVVLEDWFLYGLEEGNRIDVLVNEDGSAELSARIDARRNPQQFIGKLSELATLIECGLFSAEYWKPVEASPEAIRLSLEKSRAATFVLDPIKVLRGANSGA
ncbi:MAG: hypothetical protein KF892_23900 [Rhizobacter sp.]|nr:hypothetical protein [Rhizobacter sp.]